MAKLRGFLTSTLGAGKFYASRFVHFTSITQGVGCQCARGGEENECLWLEFKLDTQSIADPYFVVMLLTY